MWGAFLSPTVALAGYVAGAVPKTVLLPTLAAQLVTAVVIYPLYAFLFPVSLVFGPNCNTTLTSCLALETASTFSLTLLCSLPLLYPSASSLTKSCWIGLSVRAMLEWTVLKTGTCMNVMIAFAWFGYNGTLLTAEAGVYVLGATAGSFLGVGVFGFVARWWEGGKVKVD